MAGPVFLLPVVVFLLPVVFGQYASYDYGLDFSHHVKRQVDQPLVTRGEMGMAIQPRLEIRQLEQDHEQWSLYILALSMLQFTNQESPLSWYGLTGIHGVPHQTWGGVGPTPGNENTGYCTHSSILFPTWHRPYLVLYEQVMYDLVQTIAAFYPSGTPRDRHRAAAARFRIPYWDWAAMAPSGQSVLPLSVGGSSWIDIDGPNGKQRIANPLYSYTFKPLNATAFLHGPWNIWTSTLRSPTTNDNTAISNNSLVARNFDQNLPSVSQRLYNLFSNNANYTTFSNNAWIPLGSNESYDSLESLHDTVHTLAGGGGFGQPNTQGGHMSFIPYSGFDPIFWLHHTNVDRIFAIWQALYPDTWVTPQAAALASYTTSKGEIQDSTTALTPFFASADGTFWTSDTVRDYTKFGYTYPELMAGPNSSTKARARVVKAINRLYGASSPASLFIKEAKSAVSKTPRAKRQVSGQTGSQGNTGTSNEEQLSKPVNRGVFSGHQYREWIANIRIMKQALSEPFAIHLFLGDAPRDTRQWPFSKNHIGMMGVFASTDAHGISAAHLDVSGTVPLTAALVEKVVSGQLTSLDPQDVEVYLRLNLQKRVLGSRGRLYDVASIDGLKVEIASSVVRAPKTEEELPEWGAMVVHFEMR